jgi:hypothetical protein
VSTKKKKYFKANGDGVSVPSRAFLLKWFDDKTASVKYDGPFSNERDADDLLKTYLKSGVCCWKINYDE